MTTPFFSIVMPTLDSARTVEASVRSVLAQTWRDLELVVMDGGSRDGTVALVEAIAHDDRRVRLVRERDDGIYDAMNRGMGHARGQWLHFLGSDDTFAATDVLARVVARSDGENVLYGDVRVRGDASFARDGDLYDGPFDLPKLFTKNICHQAIFYRKAFVDTAVGRYVARYRTCADWDFNLRCRAATEFAYLGFVVCDFQAGGQSTARADDPAFAESFVERSLGYFGMSPFDPVACAGFGSRHELKVLQRRRSLARFAWRRTKRMCASFISRHAHAATRPPSP